MGAMPYHAMYKTCAAACCLSDIQNRVRSTAQQNISFSVSKVSDFCVLAYSIPGLLSCTSPTILCHRLGNSACNLPTHVLIMQHHHVMQKVISELLTIESTRDSAPRLGIRLNRSHYRLRKKKSELSSAQLAYLQALGDTKVTRIFGTSDARQLSQHTEHNTTERRGWASAAE
ncbi:hypothetical protein BDW69DRAFT_18507 [Aspergillus filifer]